MTLITGLPGRGKTLYAVQLVREAVTAGRKVYSDIEGLKIPHEPIPADFDWRDTPSGSFIVYDEVHRRFPSSGRAGLSPDDQVNRLDTHRHSGHDFIFVTQYPGKVHKVIRDLVDRHVHLVRAFGLQGTLLHEWGFCQASPDSPTARREADKVRWKFPRDLYKSYQSASTHARYNALQLPGRAWLLPALAIAAVLLCWRIYASWSDRVHHVAADVAVDLTGGVRELGRSPVSTAAGQLVRGCVSYPAITGVQRCVCVGAAGESVQLALATCLEVAEDPWLTSPASSDWTPPAPYYPPLGVIGSTGNGPLSASSGPSSAQPGSHQQGS